SRPPIIGDRPAARIGDLARPGDTRPKPAAARRPKPAAGRAARTPARPRSGAFRPVGLRLELRVGQKTRRALGRLELDEMILPIELHLRGERQRAVAAAVFRQIELDDGVLKLRIAGASVGGPRREIVGAETLIGHERDALALLGRDAVRVLYGVADARVAAPDISERRHLAKVVGEARLRRERGDDGRSAGLVGPL